MFNSLENSFESLKRSAVQAATSATTSIKQSSQEMFQAGQKLITDTQYSIQRVKTQKLATQCSTLLSDLKIAQQLLKGIEQQTTELSSKACLTETEKNVKQKAEEAQQELSVIIPFVSAKEQALKDHNSALKLFPQKIKQTISADDLEIITQKNNEAEQTLKNLENSNQQLQIAIAYGRIQNFRMDFTRLLADEKEIGIFFERNYSLQKDILDTILSYRFPDGGLGGETLDLFSEKIKEQLELDQQVFSQYQTVCQYQFYMQESLACIKGICENFITVIEKRNKIPADINDSINFSVEHIKINLTELRKIAQKHNNAFPLDIDALEKTLRVKETGLLDFVLAKIDPAMREEEARKYKETKLTQLIDKAKALANGLSEEEQPQPPADNIDDVDIDITVEEYKKYILLLEEIHAIRPLKKQLATLQNETQTLLKLFDTNKLKVPPFPNKKQSWNSAETNNEKEKTLTLLNHTITAQQDYNIQLSSIILEKTRQELDKLSTQANELRKKLTQPPTLPSLENTRKTFISEFEKKKDLLDRQIRQQQQYLSAMNAALKEQTLKEQQQKLTQSLKDTADEHKKLLSETTQLKLELKKLSNSLPAKPELKKASQFLSEIDSQIEWEQSLEGQLDQKTRELEQLNAYKTLLEKALQEAKPASQNKTAASAKATSSSKTKTHPPTNRTALSKLGFRDQVLNLYVNDYDTKENRQYYKGEKLGPYKKPVSFSAFKCVARRHHTRSNMIKLVRWITEQKVDNRDQLLYAALLVIQKAIAQQKPYFTSMLMCITLDLLSKQPQKSQKTINTSLSKLSIFIRNKNAPKAGRWFEKAINPLLNESQTINV